MDFLGIGPLELVFIVLLMLIIMGPRDMVKTGAALGRFIRELMRSPTWQVVQETSRRLRSLPSTLASEAGIEEFQKEIQEAARMPEISGYQELTGGEDFSLEAWTRPLKPKAGNSEQPESADASQSDSPSLGAAWTNPGSERTAPEPTEKE